jgi:hypothetical protein
MVAPMPALAQECQIGPPKHQKGPLVLMDYDQVDLDADCKQEVYQPQSKGGAVAGDLYQTQFESRSRPIDQRSPAKVAIPSGNEM